MPIPARRDRLAWLWSTAWAALGAAYGLCLGAILTVGPFLLLVPVAATVVLARSPRTWRSWPGLVVGISALPFVIAFLNRSGPGLVCTTTPTAQSCTQEYSPWPFVVAGVVLFSAGVLLLLARRRRYSDR